LIICRNSFYFNTCLSSTESLQIESITPKFEAYINDSVVLQCIGSSRTNKPLNISWNDRNGTVLSEDWVTTAVKDGRIISNVTIDITQQEMFGTYKCNLTDGKCSIAETTTITLSGELTAI